jgi:hypothetical protein
MIPGAGAPATSSKTICLVASATRFAGRGGAEGELVAAPPGLVSGVRPLRPGRPVPGPTVRE